MRKSRLLSLMVCGALVLGLSSCGVKTSNNESVKETNSCEDDEIDAVKAVMDPAKPVIYLYPEEEMNVKVDLKLNGGELSCTYPKYDNGWEVLAHPSGVLTDKDKKQYNYLYWEGLGTYKVDFSEGYCVKGEDTSEFLETKLTELGLNSKEANEFIVYWLPLMETNKYNVILFDTKEYEKFAELNVNPKPDNIIRVFMQFYASEEFVDLKEPEVNEMPNRSGFTVVEWGGSELKR